MAHAVAHRAVASFNRRGYLAQTAVVFLAYCVAGKLGQATANIRSSNLGPVWPAYGIALAAIVLLGHRAWVGVFAGALLVALSSPVPVVTAIGQAAAATLAALFGAYCLRVLVNFDPCLSHLRDALWLVAIGALGSAIVSSSIGASVLYASHEHPYSGLSSAWLIYWLGDAMGVLLVTPLVLTFPDLLRIRNRDRLMELVTLLVLLTVACVTVFGDLPRVTNEVHVLSLIVLPFVMWAAIRFGVSGAALSILVVATIATVETALGSGPFVVNGSFANAVLLDIFFGVLSVTGLALAVLCTEREQGQRERERMVRKQAAIEAYLQNQRVLQESEQRLRVAAQAGKMYAYEWDVASDSVARSGGVEAVLGPPEQFPGDTRQEWLARVHPDDRERLDASVSERTPESPDSQVAYRILRPDGSIIWLERTAHALFDEHRKMTRMIGMVADITERKLAEERLREYEKAVEGSEDMIAVVDRDYRYLIANRQFLKMRNTTKNQVIGRSAREVLNEEVFETRVKPKLDECFEGNVIRYEMKYMYPEIGERDLLVSYFPIEGPTGIDRAACILQDITNQKLAEETRFRHAAIVESSSDAIISENCNGVITSWNAGAQHIFGYKEAEAVGQPMTIVIPPDLLAEENRILERVRAGERIEHYETVRVTKTGKRVDVSVTVSPIKDSAGKIVGFSKIDRDTTERRLAEQVMADMSRKLVQVQEEERTRIARDLHDDINQRLALLAIEIDTLKANVPERVNEINRRLTQIREGIVEVSSGVQSISHQLHSPQLEYLGIAAAMRIFCREYSARQAVEIDFAIDEIPHVTSPDVSLGLFRIMQEALSNAAKHSRVRKFHVRLGCSASQLHLTVSDHGTGFDAKAAMNKGGLGLISMRERVRLMNGTMTIESKLMGGTIIHVCVPIESEQVSARAAG